MTPEEVLDRWFSSDVWQQITSDTQDGCEDSLELLELVYDQLGSLIFHLTNESSDKRVEYELSFFIKLCDDFGVA